MKKITLLVLFSCITLLVKAQHTDTTEVKSGFNVFDRFGNKYTPEVAAMESMSPINLICDAGYYSLYSDYTAGGLTTSEENVICRVFSDLSDFITPISEDIPSINIRVKDVTSSSDALGSASSYYINYDNNSEIVDPIPWHIINGGVDPFSNLLDYNLLPNFNYHGFVNINNTYDFHTDLLTDATTTGFYDLYSVVLHEVTHSLGFASTIGLYGGFGYNGSNIFSRYDTYLETAEGQSLLNNGATCFENTFIEDFDPIFNYNVDCSNSIWFNGTNTYEPVFTSGDPDLSGSNLSHFISNCDGSPTYVMNWNLAPGVTNRTLTQNEAFALCEIGYRINDTYGASSLPLSYQTGYAPCGSIIAGNHDFTDATGAILQVPVDEEIEFSLNDLLYNDVNAESIECIEALSGGSISYGSLDGPFTYAPDPVSYFQYLRYIPVDANGNKGNTTYILIKNIYPSLCESPLQDECNLVCGGDFENPFTNMNALSEYTIDIDNSPDIYDEGANHYGFMGYGTKHEGFSLELSETLMPSISYELRFRLRKGNSNTTFIDIVASQILPCSTGTNAMYGTPYTCDDESNYFGEVITVDHLITSEDWYEVSVIFTLSEPANYISLFNSFSNTGVGGAKNVNVDDVFIQRTELFADAGEDVEICLGESTNLGGTPTANGNSTYFWQGDDGTVYTTANPVVSPTTTTTYTLMVSSPNCQILGTDQVKVYVIECCTVDAEAGVNVEICPGEIVILGGNPTSSLTGDIVYYWEGSDGSIYNIPNPIVAPIETTTYNLLVTKEDCHGQAVDQIVIEVQDCCPVPQEALNYNLLYSSDIGSSVSDQEIYINELFMVDADFEFSGCTIYLGEYARIEIESSEVTFKTCTLKACSDIMWDGIYAEQADESIIFINTVAMQAKNAIFGQFNAPISVSDNSLFTSNHIGILLKHYSDAVSVNVVNSSFIGGGPLLAPHSMSIGIDAYNLSNLQIGQYNTSNKFSRIDIGMRLLDVDMYSLNNSYEECNYAIGEKMLPYIDGVTNYDYLDNNELKVEECTFKDVGYGIYSWGFTSGLSGIKLDVNSNEFSNCSYKAIQGVNLLGANVNNNEIVHSNYGIYLANVNSNAEYPYWNYQAVNITNNSLSNIYRYGIWTVNVGDYYDSWATQINNNTLNFNSDNAFRTGINVENCDQIQIHNNDIVRSSDPYLANEIENLNGIWLEESMAAQVYENTITRMGHGIHGIGSLLYTDFYCNYLNKDFHGFHFDQNYTTAISHQGGIGLPTDNKWVDSDFELGMRVEANFPLLDLPLWYYKDYFMYDAEFESTTTIDFEETTGSHECSWEDNPWEDFPNNDELLKVAEGNYEYAELDEEYKHRERKKVYDKLRKEPSLYLNNTILQNFFELMEESPLKRILNVNEKMSENDFAQAIIENEQIISDKLYVQNRKTVNSIYLNSLIDGSEISEEDKATLENIALITPYLGGDAVYSARVLLDMDVMDYDIEYRTDGSNELQMVKRNPFVKVYPNPVKNDMVIDLLNDFEEVITLSIYDLKGTLVIEIV